MVGCDLSYNETPLKESPYCKIILSNFDIELDLLQVFLSQNGITFITEHNDPEPKETQSWSMSSTQITEIYIRPLVCSMKNYYYYTDMRRMVGSQKKQYISFIFATPFFEKYSVTLNDIKELLCGDSTLPLLFLNSESEVFSRFVRLLMKIKINGCIINANYN